MVSLLVFIWPEYYISYSRVVIPALVLSLIPKGYPYYPSIISIAHILTLLQATYHGVSPCKFKTKEQRKILDTYMAGSYEEKKFMEKR